MRKCGFIGLGDQGAPIAKRMIYSGLPMVLWARRPQTLEPFVETSAELTLDIEELALKVDYVGICVVDDEGVSNICAQLLPLLRSGSIVVIHSTVSPALCKQLEEQAGIRGIRLIDAPVSGGGNAAAAGKLTVMVGGDKAVLDDTRAVLETFAAFIFHLGGVGAGQQAKLINNALLAANIGLAHQAIEAAALLRLEESAFIRLIKESSGRSFGFEVRARMPQPTAFRHGAELLKKDVALLGGILGDQPCFELIDSAAGSFLALALDQNDRSQDVGASL